MLRKPWTEEDNQRLAELWPTHSAGVLAKMFGMSRNAIIGRAHRMKINKITGLSETVRSPNKAVPWSKKSDDLLRSNWGKGRSVIDILRLLAEHGEPRTMSSLRHRVERMGLPRVSDVYSRAPVKLTYRRASRTLTPKPLAPPPKPWDGPCISILDDKLSRFMCREIVAGEGVGTMFCGAPTSPDSQFSYCAFHAAKNLTPATQKKARPHFRPYRIAA